MTATAAPTTATMPVGSDDEPNGDGLPVWSPVEGTPVICGVLAWRSLGVGHRCQTILGWSTSRWAPVTVKLARPHQIHSPRARLALDREIAALHAGPHPGLPQLYDHDVTGRLPYLVEQFLNGPDLDDLLVRRRVLTGSIAELAAQLLAALVPLHARGLAHLDVKPANVIICDGRAVLIDLGSARRFGTRQRAGHPVGTEGFASPELENCRPISAAMDIYGVGATLDFAWHHRRPIGHRAAELRRLITDLTAEQPASRPTLAQALDRSAALCPPRRRPWPVWLDPRTIPPQWTSASRLSGSGRTVQP